MKIGYQLWSINDVITDLVQAELMISRLKAIGYDGVELYNIDDSTQFEQIVALLGKYDLEIVSAHCDYQLLASDYEVQLDKYDGLGIKNIVIPIVGQITQSQERCNEVITNIKAIKEVAKTRGINIFYHNHDLECVKIDDKLVIDYIGEAGIKLEYDVHWLIRGGLDPYRIIATKYPAPLIHVKDIILEKIEGDYRLIDCAVGYGNLDLKRLVNICKEREVKWLIVEQEYNQPTIEKRIVDCEVGYQSLVRSQDEN